MQDGTWKREPSLSVPACWHGGPKLGGLAVLVHGGLGGLAKRCNYSAFTAWRRLPRAMLPCSSTTSGQSSDRQNRQAPGVGVGNPTPGACAPGLEARGDK